MRLCQLVPVLETTTLERGLPGSASPFVARSRGILDSWFNASNCDSYPRASRPRGDAMIPALFTKGRRLKLFINGASDQDRSAINHQRLTRGECFLHKEQIGLRYVMRFADSAHRQTVAHAL